MRIKKIKRIGIGFISVILFSGLALAPEKTQAADSSQAMPLTNEGGTARAMSMGSAVVGVPQGSASLFWNPAGLGRLGSCMELGLHHNSGLGESIHETAVFSKGMGALGGFAASLNYVDNGDFEGRDEAGNETADYTAGDLGAGLGWGQQWFYGISAGMALKYNKQTIDDKSYSAYAADLGLLWDAPIERLDLGVTYSNLGSEVAGSRLDSSWRMGASYGLTDDMLLAASSELKSEGFERLQLGVESIFLQDFALRAGYVYNLTDSKLDGLTGLTAGLGTTIVEDLMLDYAYVPYGDLGDSHRISLTYKFPCSEKAVKDPPSSVEPKEAAVKSEPEVVKPEPAKAKPDAVVLEKIIVLEDKDFKFNVNTQFEFDSVALTEEGEKVVKENTQIMKDNPEAKIRIAGYASASGSEAYNQKLSELRAETIKQTLVNSGIDKKRITTIGYGETRPAMVEPIPKNIDSEEARANRRVLFEIIVK